MRARLFWSMIVVCVFLPGAARAQYGVGGIGTHGFPYGPRVAPPWNYPGLYGGPFVTYPPPGSAGGVGVFAYHNSFGVGGRTGSTCSTGLSLHCPPVPVYGPIPDVFGNDDLVRHWHSTHRPVFPVYGWFGPFAASPRPRPLSVSVWPVVGPGTGPVAPVPAAAVGGCLVLSVKVPQPATEVFVDGKKTQQTGTDRIFESPPLEAGQNYRYTVTARWVERGQVVEVSRDVTGTAGEMVRVDFAAPAVAGK